jgi:hypothetical protein
VAAACTEALVKNMPMITFLPQPNGIETKLLPAPPAQAALLNSSLGGH